MRSAIVVALGVLVASLISGCGGSPDPGPTPPSQTCGGVGQDCCASGAPCSGGLTCQGAKCQVAPAGTYSISGTVSGVSASGVSVGLSGASTASTTTNSSGAYQFSGLANGSYVVTPSLSGLLFDPERLEVSVAGVDVTARDFAGTNPCAGYGSDYCASVPLVGCIQLRWGAILQLPGTHLQGCHARLHVERWCVGQYGRGRRHRDGSPPLSLQNRCACPPAIRDGVEQHHWFDRQHWIRACCGCRRIAGATRLHRHALRLRHDGHPNVVENGDSPEPPLVDSSSGISPGSLYHLRRSDSGMLRR